MKLTFDVADIKISANRGATAQQNVAGKSNEVQVYEAKPEQKFSLELSGISYSVEFAADELPAIYKEVLPMVKEIVPVVKDVFVSIIEKAMELEEKKGKFRERELALREREQAFKEQRHRDERRDAE